MNNEETSSPLHLGSWLFYICWLAAIFFIVIITFCDYFTFNSTQQFFMVFFIVGLLILPFLKSMSVGNFFKIEIREVKKSIQELREKIIDLKISNTQATTIINSISEYGENISTSTKAESKKFYKKAEELRVNGKYIESLNFYKMSLEADRNNWLSAFYLGAIYLSLTDLGIVKRYWDFDEYERLSNALFYSQYATKIDKAHFGQFLNLAIAQQHIGGDKLLELSIKSFNNTVDILKRDPNLKYDAKLKIAHGKSLHFKAMSLSSLNRIDEAIRNDVEAIHIFENCPEPAPNELPKWLKQAKDHLNMLKESKNNS